MQFHWSVCRQNWRFLEQAYLFAIKYAVKHIKIFGRLKKNAELCIANLKTIFFTLEIVPIGNP